MRSMLLGSARYRATQLSSMTRVVVASRYLRRQVEAVLPGRTATVVHNPIDPTEVRGAGLHGGAPIAGDFSGCPIAIVGSLTEKKGQRALLDRLPDILRAVPLPHLHLAGDGPDRLPIAALVRRHHAEDVVTLHGQLSRDRTYRLLAACRIAAVTALWPEPFGRVAIEAASLGLPVVAFDTGGLAELIDHGRTGILVEPGNYGAFVAALARLAHDPALCRRMGHAARARVERDHHPRAAAQQLAAVWSAARAEHECTLANVAA